MHAEICPICKGSGKLPVVDDGQTTNFPNDRLCYGCGGVGWVPLPDEPYYYPWYHYAYHYRWTPRNGWIEIDNKS